MYNQNLQAVPPRFLSVHQQLMRRFGSTRSSRVEIRKEGKWLRLLPGTVTTNENLADAYEIGPEKSSDTYVATQHVDGLVVTLTRWTR